MSEDDGMKVADLEVEFAELDGYTAEARAGELLLGLGIPIEQHFGPMSAVAPGWKLRVLLAQALFADPDIMLLDEPTNNLDINTIRWLEDMLNERNSTMIIISHDRHFLNSVCTHMADLDYGELRVYPGNYDEYMTAVDPGARAAVRRQRQEEGPDRRTADLRQPLLRQRLQGQAGHLARQADREDQAGGHQAVEPRQPVHPFRSGQEAASLALEVKRLAKGYDGMPLFSDST